MPAPATSQGTFVPWRAEMRKTSVKDFGQTLTIPVLHKRRKSSGLVSGCGPRVPRMGSGPWAKKEKADPFPRLFIPSAG